MSDDDEIIIVDDCSKDNTIEFINTLYDDKRIKVIKNEVNMGVNKSFELGLLHAKNEIVFLSDQDDIWFKNKKSKILYIFNKFNVDVVQHDAIIVDDEYNVLFESFANLRKAGSGILKNFISNTYLGCSMAFKREVLKDCLPIPKHQGYHDRWIGILSEVHGYKVMFIKEKLMYYVRHEGTGSNLKRRKLSVIINDRLDFLKALFVYYLKKLKVKS